jgi:beta-N-acetylhexosaminidase
MNRSYASAATAKLTGRKSTLCVVRRCFAALAVGLFLVLAPSGAARGGAEELTLEQQVGQLIVMSFPGAKPPRYVRDALREKRVAGVILFGGNIRSPDQLRTLTAALRAAGGRPIVAVDQEGGEVRRVPWAPPVASQSEQLADGTVRSQAAAGARALRELGITVDLAPVADVPSVRNAAIGPRAFSTDPTEVSGAVQAAVRGWRSGGVAATAKHFPGLGGTRSNTDRADVTIRRSPAALDVVDLPPFEAAIRAGVPLVMLGHARYPALDRSRIASQSEPIIEGLLRGELGFRGVVITDSMEAEASLATGSITTVCERAIRAGADIVLLTGKASYQPVYDHLLGVARRSQSFQARVQESAARVVELKAGFG